MTRAMTMHFLAILLLLSCPGALRAQDDRPPPPFGPGGPGGPGGPIPREMHLVQEFDRDKDGRLNKEERQAARQKVLAERDKARGERGPRRFGRRDSQEPPKPGPRVSPADVKAYPNGSLYAPAIVRTLFLEFEDPAWEKELADFYRTDVDVPAALSVDGRKLKDVGVHFRGSSSFFTVGEGSKRSLNLAIDHVDPKQKFHGYKTLELLSSHADPTFLRTILYYHIARHYLPAPRANFVKVVINGESWGIYVSQQQYNTDFLRDWFGTRKGIRWKMPANPRGGQGLGYPGEDLEEYKRRYKLQTKDADEGKAWADLIRLCKTLKETPQEQLEGALQPLLDVDRALWLLALDNVLINDDGYWIRASDFNLYQDERGRFHTLPHDANESFRLPGGPGFGRSVEIAGVELNPLFGAADPDKPLISRLLAVPGLKARYLAHVRTLAEDWLDWGKLGPLADRLQALIDVEVKADTRKLDDYDRFKKGPVEDYEEESFRGNRKVLSLKSFVEARRKYLLGHAELAKPAPRITSLSYHVLRNGSSLPATPRPGESVRITVEVAGDTRPEQVFLHYSSGRELPFLRLEMAKAKEDRFTADIPPLPAGTRVRYYVEARATTAGTASFLPREAELGALRYEVRAEE